MDRGVAKVIGKGTVYDIDLKQDVEVSIQKLKLADYIYYSLVISSDKNEIDKLGEISFFVVHGAEIPFGQFAGKIPEEGKKVSTLRVSWMYSKYVGKYKGVGMLLMKAVVERSWKETNKCDGKIVGSCMGKVTLCAAGFSHGFYRAVGYCTDEGSNLDKIIDEKVSEAKSKGTRCAFEKTGMHFPPEAITSWKHKITLAPVLSKTSGWMKV